MNTNQFSSNKIFYHQHRLLKVLNGEMSLPAVIEISLCGNCNHNCIYCCNKPFKSNLVLSKSNIDNIISQICPFIQAVTITGGGEPMLNENFLYCIEKLVEREIPYGVITNGTHCTIEQLEIISKTASFFRVSLDSMNETIYSEIRNPDNSIADVLNNITILHDMKEKNHGNVLIGLQVVWVNQTLSDIENTVKQSKALKIDFTQIRPVDNIPYSDFKPKYDLFTKNKDFLQRLKTEYSSRIFNVIPSEEKFSEYYSYSVGKDYLGCPGGNFTASIGHDNKVYFCCTHLGNSAYLLGDLAKQPISEILLSAKRQNLIESCNHSGCQYQCRNHNINKLLSKLLVMQKNEFDQINSLINLENKPLHWQFL